MKEGYGHSLRVITMVEWVSILDDIKTLIRLHSTFAMSLPDRTGVVYRILPLYYAASYIFVRQTLQHLLLVTVPSTYRARCTVAVPMTLGSRESRQPHPWEHRTMLACLLFVIVMTPRHIMYSRRFDLGTYLSPTKPYCHCVACTALHQRTIRNLHNTTLVCICC